VNESGSPAALAARVVRRPRLGFLGVGWIGASRMHALAATGLANVVAVAEPDPGSRTEAVARLPGAAGVSDLTELLAMDLDGVVIATPSALHAEQALQALAQGVAVFCQKPLGRDLAETQAVIHAARAADRLLGVDLSYRHLAAVRAVRRLLTCGELGRVYAADLTFHNAYGPDKPWFTQRSLSGGGCLIDLGTHLLDLILWLTEGGDAQVRSSVLRRGGEPLASETEAVEDFAQTHLRLDSGVDVRLACSWFLPAGRDCVIEMTLYGTEGAASVRNVDGSFFDFRAEHWRGTHTEVVAHPPDDWGARALIRWTERLAQTASFDPAAEEYASLAGILDNIYRTAA
jgi:predicted dehydrogenase